MTEDLNKDLMGLTELNPFQGCSPSSRLQMFNEQLAKSANSDEVVVISMEMSDKEMRQRLALSQLDPRGNLYSDVLRADMSPVDREAFIKMLQTPIPAGQKILFTREWCASINRSMDRYRKLEVYRRLTQAIQGTSRATKVKVRRWAREGFSVEQILVKLKEHRKESKK